LTLWSFSVYNSTMGSFIDITGQKFHRLLVLGRSKNKGARVVWKCLCNCGNISYAHSSDIRHSKHKSCGCLHLEAITIHGATKQGGIRTPEYSSWVCMIGRCQNDKLPGWHRYGGRGIIVCTRWRKSFSNFLKDMGTKPTPTHSIDRIDNDGNYCPKNCKWSTPKEQAANRIYVKPEPRPRGKDGRFITGLSSCSC